MEGYVAKNGLPKFAMDDVEIVLDEFPHYQVQLGNEFTIFVVVKRRNCFADT